MGRGRELGRAELTGNILLIGTDERNKSFWIRLQFNVTVKQSLNLSLFDTNLKLKLYCVADTMDTKSTLTDQQRNLFGDASGIMRYLRSRPNQE